MNIEHASRRLNIDNDKHMHAHPSKLLYALEQARYSFSLQLYNLIMLRINVVQTSCFCKDYDAQSVDPELLIEFTQLLTELAPTPPGIFTCSAPDN